MERVGMKVFSGNANLPLAEAICRELDLTLGDMKIGRFADGEINVKINETVRGYDVFFIQPTSGPVNDHLMEVLIAADAFKRASVSHINLVMPYYGYARQDRKTSGREPITAKLVADLLETAGVDRVITVDLHAGQIQGYFDIPVDHFQAAKLLATYFEPMVKDNREEWVVVSPDLGGVTRARAFSHLLDLPISIIEKHRPEANVSEVVDIIGDVSGKRCIIIDDIIDTAGTITNAANFLTKRGAKEVYITASHPLLSGSASEKILNSSVKKCVVTDTVAIPEERMNEKIEVLSMAPLLAEAIRRVYSFRSVSGLFAK
ncbi:MAG: ribose-phosphate pyrophosphokinase [Peptoniphilaceae bacterium]|nr:ribose-phosphate pyrophosphokinase [Peptoniphilaceae bacterium]MDY6085952.1 ribose-phosphate pyrophosphokinase [Peptoniphilaceae bacterium]